MTSPIVQARFQQALSSIIEAVRRRPVLTQTTFAAGSIVLLVSAYRDYRAFLALGPGGIPYNAFGWLINLLILRPLALSYSGRLYVGDYPSSGARKVIRDLPVRTGTRPVADGIVPHRQMTDQADESMKLPLRQMMIAFMEESEFVGKLEVKRSHYELHNDALFVAPAILHSDLEKAKLPRTAIVAKGEITHVHPDRSVHVYLHPADARLVIEKGWGERHRLSRTWPWWIGWRQDFLGLCHTWIMVYGARDDKEVDIVKSIVREGVSWMVGRRNEG